MPKPISTPLEKQFRLDKWDPDGDSSITVRQARQWQHEKREELFAETSRVWREGDMGEVELKSRVSFSEVTRTEVFLTLVDSNLPDETGKPIFKFRKDGNGRQILDMTSTEFSYAWGQLEPELCAEIHDKVLEVCPMWKGKG